MGNHICYIIWRWKAIHDERIEVMIGQRVRQLREERGWNQSELAAEAGLTPAAVSQIEGDKRKPSAETLNGLADALEVSTDFLMGRKPDEEFLGEAEEARGLLRGIHELSAEDRKTVRAMVDALRRKRGGEQD